MSPASFDDELRRAIGSLAERLEHDIADHLNHISTELAAALESERAAIASKATAEAAALADARERERAAAAAEALAAAEAERKAAVDRAVAEAEIARAAAVAEALAAAEAAHAAAVEEAFAHAEAARVAAVNEALAAAEEARAAAVAGALAASDAARAAAIEDARAAAEAAARQEIKDAHTQAKASEQAARERLLDAVRALDRARSLSEILDTLVSCAGREAPRAAVLVTEGAVLRGWRLIGFDPAFSDGAQVRVDGGDPSHAGVLAQAIASRAAAAARSTNMAPDFARSASPCEMLAVPLAVGGQVVAVLYADRGGQDIERVGWASAVELLGRHAARALESTLAFRAARLATGWPERAGEGASGGDEARTSAPAQGAFRDDAGSGSPNEEESARRYARLLVSEIKLYHEREVMAGRRERNLMSRLGGEIAHARVQYEQRVPAQVRAATNHFQEELVRTLAGGDASLLEAEARP